MHISLITGSTENSSYANETVKELSEILQNKAHTVSVTPFVDDIQKILVENKSLLAFIVDSSYGGKNSRILQLGINALRVLLDEIHIPYTGPTADEELISNNKLTTKKYFQHAGLIIPKYRAIDNTISLTEQIHTIQDSFLFPMVVKASEKHWSLGVRVVYSTEELLQTMKNFIDEFGSIFVEEYKVGTEVTVPVIERDGIPVALAATEIEFTGDYFSESIKLQDFVDALENKTTTSRYFTPARLDQNVYKALLHSAEIAHRTIGLLGYSRSDFIVKDNIAYLLEINDTPVLHSKDFIGWGAKAQAITYEKVIDDIITAALAKSKYNKKLID